MYIVMGLLLKCQISILAEALVGQPVSQQALNVRELESA